TLFKTDRISVANQVILPDNPELTTIDKLSSLVPGVSTGTYNMTVEYSIATDAELKAAGTSYPDWIAPYRNLSDGYRDPVVLERIHQLAVQVTQDAGATTPYDKARAIEAYLRDPKNFTYTLTPPIAPFNVDPISYFLFNSHKGYCE